MMIRRSLSVLMFCMVLSVSGQNVIRNGDFEHGLKPWHPVGEWRDSRISAAEDAHGGAGAMHLEPGSGDTAGVFCRGNYVDTSFGERWCIRMWAKGTGHLQAGIHEHGGPCEQPGRIYHAGFHWLPAQRLSPEWHRHEFIYTGKRDDLDRILFMVKIQGTGAQALIDDVEAVRMPEEGWRISGVPGSLAAAPGRTVSGEALITFRGKPAAGEKVLIHSRELLPEKYLSLTTDAGGKIRFELNLSGGVKTGEKVLGASCPARGIGCRIAVDVISEALFEQLDRLASGCRNPGEVLVLGDSLTDFRRGYNYVDTVQFMLNRHFPGKVSWRNYGIRGDTAPRMLDRLQGKRGVYALNRYKGIYETRPALVLIFLGHNDSMLMNGAAGPDSRKKVSPEDFQKGLTDIVAFVRKQWHPHEIMLMTPMKSDMKKNLNYGKRYGLKCLFGEPSLMKQYADIVKTVAAAAGCRALDLHGLSADCASRNDIFVGDGVHVTNAGNKLIAVAVLKMLR